jgi:isopenicillin-N epimerase
MPVFGHRMRAEWALDPGTLYLNHGTVGATPRRVLARQQSIRDEMEKQPARFLLRECSGLVTTLTARSRRPPHFSRVGPVRGW